ncbi:unnamed protein product [Ixodes pacificus]
MFDCCDTGNWKCKIARWERYRILSGLHLRNAETLLSTFLHAMGREAEDVFTEADRRQRLIFHLARILALKGRLSQLAIEAAEAFLTELHYGPSNTETWTSPNLLFLFILGF